MLTKKEIVSFHSRENLGESQKRVGIELELFCIDSHTSKRVPYQSYNGHVSVQQLFEYLKAHEEYSDVDMAKTFTLVKGKSKVTLEPGAQVEFGSSPQENLTDLFQELEAYLAVLRRLTEEFGVSWLDVAYFPIGDPCDVPLLPSARSEIIDSYWQRTGHLARDLMRYTTSIHVSFDYNNESDLAEKIKRALLLKPILLFISANSRIRAGRDTGLRSFRTMTYRDTDAPRMGTPGPESLWTSGQWTLDGYVEKVLQAPSIFSVGTSSYTESSHEPFVFSLKDASFEDYLSHLATMYTDIRVRQYFEIRYLDNPGVQLIPGLVIVLHKLIYDDAAWGTFARYIPYTFAEVPAITDLLNSVSEASSDYWEHKLLRPLEGFLLDLQTDLQVALSQHLNRVLDRVVNYRMRDELPDLSSDTRIISHFKSLFPF